MRIKFWITSFTSLVICVVCYFFLFIKETSETSINVSYNEEINKRLPNDSIDSLDENLDSLAFYRRQKHLDKIESMGSKGSGYGGAFYHRNDNHTLSLEENFSLLKPVLIWLIMILGMLCSTLFENLTNLSSGEKIQHLIFIKQCCQSAGFFRALIVSPLILFFSYNLISKVPDNTVAFFYAFQNGFFWLTTFNKIKLSQTKSESSASKVT